MKQDKRWLLVACAVALEMGGAARSWATDGYFSHGYGMRAKGMGGASAAVTGDAYGGANNPATMVEAGEQLEIGVDWFRPVRSADRSGAALAPLNGSVSSGSQDFFIPEIAYSHRLRQDLAMGVTVYGNGGMNTDYPQGSFQCPNARFQFGPANMLCGSGRLGVDLSQLIVAPTLAWKFAPGQSLGLAPQLAYQRFKIDGAQLFGMNSSDPAHVSNGGYDSSTGLGLRLGYLAEINERLKVGVSYGMRIHMSPFSSYSGLFPEQGRFDLPPNITVGLSFKPTTALLLALDYKRIDYSGLAAVGNPSTNFFRAQLGAPNGPGFGWQDVNTLKLGVEWQVNPQWVLRGGLAHASNPVQARDVTFNILAPGIVQDQFTAGFSRSFGPDQTLTVALMHAPERSVSGASLLNPLFQSQGAPANAAGTETVRLREDSLGLAWTWQL
ncbi:MAG: outer membrane protein transport protein [Pseudomonadota bacterium]|nr:outer membrane protein transport protein [Pseudomonadota bacterium]